MPYWEFFTSVARVSDTIGVRWYWRHNKGHVSPAFATLRECVEDARQHGLKDESIEIVPPPSVGSGDTAIPK